MTLTKCKRLYMLSKRNVLSKVNVTMKYQSAVSTEVDRHRTHVLHLFC